MHAIALAVFLLQQEQTHFVNEAGKDCCIRLRTERAAKMENSNCFSDVFKSWGKFVLYHSVVCYCVTVFLLGTRPSRYSFSQRKSEKLKGRRLRRAERTAKLRIFFVLVVHFVCVLTKTIPWLISIVCQQTSTSSFGRGSSEVVIIIRLCARSAPKNCFKLS